MSVIADILNGLATLLAAGTFSLTVTPVRSWFVSYDVSELEALKVTVTPKTTERSIISRRTSEQTVDYYIALQQKARDIDDLDAEMVPLLTLAQEYHDYLFTNRQLMLPDGSRALYAGSVQDVIYDVPTLMAKGVITSLMTVSYRYYGSSG